MTTGSPLTAQEFDWFRALAYRHSGLDLAPGKQPIVAARLGRKLRELNLQSYRAYRRHIQEDSSGKALEEMIDALTTSHTSFFRELPHFEFLRFHILPALRLRSHIGLWSAACATGEEPYTIAFCIHDEGGTASLEKTRILATDISTRVLGIAKAGVYAADRLQAIPANQLRNYFLRGSGAHGGNYLVKKQFRQPTEFRRVNLTDHSESLGPFPVIFCRNVMIYFDRQTQQSVARRLAASLEPGGYLFVGHAESLGGLDQPLKYVQPGIYRNPGALSPVSGS